MQNSDKLLNKAKAYTVALWQDVCNKVKSDFAKLAAKPIGDALGESAVDLSHCLLDAPSGADKAEKEFCEKTRKSWLREVWTAATCKIHKSLKE
jgi:hypothetical protein